MQDRQRRLIDAALDGELDDQAQRELEAAASDGAEFAKELQLAREAHAALRSLCETAEPRPERADQIMRAVQQSGQARPGLFSIFTKKLAVPTWALALALLIAAVGLILSATSGQDGKAPSVPSVAVAKSPTQCQAKREIVYRFVYHSDTAKTVSLVGDFNDWSESATGLADPNRDGLWTVDVKLKPGRYKYKFLVDGKTWIVDPLAPAFHADGFGGRNSVISL